jgi:hypothetical protein
LPIGVQVVTRPWEEPLALLAARVIEQSRGAWIAPPEPFGSNVYGGAEAVGAEAGGANRLRQGYGESAEASAKAEAPLPQVVAPS